MKFLKFTYTKDNASVSERQVVELVAPSTAHEGIDISELDDAGQHRLMLEMQRLEAQYVADMAELLRDFDCNNRYRKFLPERMSKVSRKLMPVI